VEIFKVLESVETDHRYRKVLKTDADLENEDAYYTVGYPCYYYYNCFTALRILSGTTQVRQLPER